MASPTAAQSPASTAVTRPPACPAGGSAAILASRKAVSIIASAPSAIGMR